MAIAWVTVSARALLLAIGSSSLVACASPPPALPLLASESFAWTAESATPGDGRVVLLGSVHVGRAPFVLGPVLERAFARCDVLVLELDSTGLEAAGSLQLMRRYARLPSPETLANHVSPRVYEKLVAWARRRGQPVSVYAAFKPWFVALLVEIEEFQALGYKQEYGSEGQLMALAERQGKPIEGLESAAEQFRIIDSLSAAAEEAMLEQSLAHSASAFEELDAMVRTGDVDRMFDFVLGDTQDPRLQEVNERVLFGRNQTMAERLLARASDGVNRFVLVGVGHMLGERGIPALLEQHGYRVQRLLSESEIGSARALVR